MGQYHALICPEAGTMVSNYDFTGGGKVVEHIHNFASPAALALLLASASGTHPRDLPWAPRGKWSGLAPLMIGDYANDYAPEGDMIDRNEILPAPEKELYERAGDKMGSLTTAHRRSKSTKAISQDMLPILERACNIRFTDFTQDGQETGRWRDVIEVAPSASHPTGWDADIEAIEPQYRENVLQYWERTDILKKDHWRRPPLAMAGHDGHSVPYHVPSAESAGVGEALIWVNLDRREFFDPAAVGDTPDLAGIMDGKSAKPVLAMICHHDPRGGGDLSDTGPLHLAGRWRGDRIVLMGTDGFKPKKGKRVHPTQIRQTFTDISGNALAFILEDDLVGSKGVHLDNQPAAVSHFDGAMAQIVKACFASPAMAGRVQTDRTSLDEISLRVVPPLRITHDFKGKALKTPIDLAGTVDLRKYGLDGAKVWLSAEAHEGLAAAVASLPRETFSIGKRDGCGAVDQSQIRVVSLQGFSNHGLMEALAA